jgi:hypothetical protein
VSRTLHALAVETIFWRLDREALEAKFGAWADSVGVACPEQRKEKPMRILDRFPMAGFRCCNRGIGHVEEILDFLTILYRGGHMPTIIRCA